MGNETSAEGGEGDLPGLPGGSGGSDHIPAGAEAIAEDGRRTAAARSCPPHRESDADVTHRAQLPGRAPAPGPSGISKSQTIDALRSGLAARQGSPGRSPSSVTVLESRSDPQGREEPRKTMFSSNFLSGANPLSAMSSAVNKLSLFGDEEAQKEAKDEEGGMKQKADPKPHQQQAPQQGSPRRTGPKKPGASKDGTEQLKDKQQGPGPPPAGPAGAGPQPPGPSVCPICKSTQLNLHTQEEPNHSTCTQCQAVVCSLCGFSPPGSAVKEWLCLNCQMQRALGGMEPPGPPPMKAQQQPPKQTSALASTTIKQAPVMEQAVKPEPGKTTDSEKPSLAKQEVLTQPGQPGSPRARKGSVSTELDPSKSKKPADQTPAGKKLDPQLPAPASAKDHTKPLQPQQSPGQHPAAEAPSGMPKVDPKAGHPLQDPGKFQQLPKGGQGPPAKSTPPPQAPPPKEESGFFGLSFGGLTEASKQFTAPQPPAESVTGKLFGFAGFTESPKPQPTAPQPVAESVTGKLFGFGGTTESPKTQPTAPEPAAESVTGKLFGFGGTAEFPKTQANASQSATESITGKLFGFGGTTETPKTQPTAPQSAAESITGKLFGSTTESPKTQPTAPESAAESITGKLFGFGGTTESPKTQPTGQKSAAESITGKLFGGTTETPKTQPTAPQTAAESITEKLFGGTTETPKTQPTAPQSAAESVAGKLFGLSGTKESPKTQPSDSQSLAESVTGKLFGFGGTTESPKILPTGQQSAAESITGKLFGSNTESPKTQPTAQQSAAELITGKLFGSTTESPKTQPTASQSASESITEKLSGGTTETPKTQPTAPQSTAESVGGKLFGFSGTKESPKIQPSDSQSVAESFTGKLFGFGGTTESPKIQPTASESAVGSITGKLFGFSGSKESPKPQPATPQPTTESITGKLFGFGGTIESPKTEPTAPQSAAEAITGKLLGFGGPRESAKTQLTTPELAAESVTGKLSGKGGLTESSTSQPTKSQLAAESVSGKLSGFSDTMEYPEIQPTTPRLAVESVTGMLFGGTMESPNTQPAVPESATESVTGLLFGGTTDSPNTQQTTRESATQLVTEVLLGGTMESQNAQPIDLEPATDLVTEVLFGGTTESPNTEPIATEPATDLVTKVLFGGTTESPNTESIVTESATELVTDVLLGSTTESPNTEPIVTESATELVTKVLFGDTTETPNTEPIVTESATELDTDVLLGSTTESPNTEPIVTESATELVTKVLFGDTTESPNTEPIVTESATELDTDVLLGSTTESPNTEPIVTESATELDTDVLLDSTTESPNTEPIVTESATELVTGMLFGGTMESPNTELIATELVPEVLLGGTTESPNTDPIVPESDTELVTGTLFRGTTEPPNTQSTTQDSARESESGKISGFSGTMESQETQPIASSSAVELGTRNLFTDTTDEPSDSKLAVQSGTGKLFGGIAESSATQPSAPQSVAESVTGKLFGFGGTKELPKIKPNDSQSAAESITGKLFGSTTESPNTQPTTPQSASEFVTGKLFGFGNTKESPKTQLSDSQSVAESVTGKFFGFGGTTESSKTQSTTPQSAAESITGKLFGSTTDIPKTQPTAPHSATESVTGKLFGFGDTKESSKTQSTAPQSVAESVTGKLFGSTTESRKTQPTAPQSASEFVTGKLFGFGNTKESPKAQLSDSQSVAESVTGKLFGFGGTTESSKTQSATPQSAAESITGKLFGSTTDIPKTQPTAPHSATESVTGKLFGFGDTKESSKTQSTAPQSVAESVTGKFFGSTTESPKTQPTAPPSAAESVTGKLFGFSDTKESPKSQPSESQSVAESVTGKLFGLGGTTESPKTQPTAPQSAAESVTGKLFGGTTETPKTQPTAPQSAAETVTGKFFGFAGTKESPKTQPSDAQSAAEAVTGKLFGGTVESSKIQPTAPQPAAESVTGKLFGGTTETLKTQPTAPQSAAESVTGKLFGFGGTKESSITQPSDSQSVAESVTGRLFGFGVTTESPKTQPTASESASESITGNLFGSTTESPNTHPTVPHSSAESVTGKLFGGTTELLKTQSTVPQSTAESVTGKLFGFGGTKESSKSQPSDSQSVAESITGKFFGFGSTKESKTQPMDSQSVADSVTGKLFGFSGTKESPKTQLSESQSVAASVKGKLFGGTTESPKTTSPQPSAESVTGKLFEGTMESAQTEPTAPQLAAESITSKLSGFGATKESQKTQPTDSQQVAESITGKLFGFAGTTESAKTQATAPQSAAESITGKLFGGTTESSKTQPTAPQSAAESITGKWFGGTTETPKTQPTAPQSAAETVTGKLFGFAGNKELPKTQPSDTQSAAEGVTGKLFGGTVESSKIQPITPQPAAKSVTGKLFGSTTETLKTQPTSPQPAAESTTGKLFGFGGTTESSKSQSTAPQSAAESVTAKFFGFGASKESPKPQPASQQSAAEPVTGKLLGFGGITESHKTRPTAPQTSDSVSGKMFGFGSSIFSSASNLISSAVQDEQPAQASSNAPPSSLQGKGAPPKEKKPLQEKVDKPLAERSNVSTTSAPPPKSSPSNCPLCKVALNMGSKDPPNYDTCTECKNTVCNLCGFNPMPHITKNEWLCLSCQTQRALAGQLGDMGMTPPPPLPPPSKPASQQKSQAVPAKEATHSGPTGVQKTAADHEAPSASPKRASISKAAGSASETTAAPADSTSPRIKDPKSTPPEKDATPVPPCEIAPLGPTSLPSPEPLQPKLCLKHPEVAHPELIHPPEAAVASSESEHSADSPLTEVDTPPSEPPAAPATASPSPESTGSSTSTDTSAELSSSPKVDAATPGHVPPFVAHTLEQATVTGPLEANIDSLYEPSLAPEVVDPSKDTEFYLESITDLEPTLPHEVAISSSESSADFSDSQSASTESAASQIPSPLFEPTPSAVEAAGHPQPDTDSVQTTTVPSVLKPSPEDVTVITKETPPPNPVTPPEKPALVPMLSSHPESRTVSLEAVTAPPERFLPLASTASPSELELAHHKSADQAEALLYCGPAHPHEASDVLPEEAGATPPPGRVLSRTTSIAQPSEGTEEEIKIEGAPLEDIDTAGQRITSSSSDMTNLETSALTTSKVQLSRTDNHLNDDGNEEKDHSPRTPLVSPESHHTHAMPAEVQQEEQSLSASHRKLKVNDAITSGAQFYDSVKDDTVAETSTVVQGVQENLSISDEEDVKRKSITERHLDLHKDEKGDIHWQKHKQEERKGKEGGTSGQYKKLVKTTSISYDEAEERPSEKQDHEYSSTLPYKDVGPVQQSLADDELESLPNSPEDRSKGEGSSSFHASSFTPGTSPTSVSSMDEDSDSSPSHKKLSEQSKQRKARHRQHGHILPTIEDSSEEEEMREEELLREQDRWGDMDQQHLAKRGSSRKSKKGKEEMCSERRGEHPAPPPRNLPPIEDASPTQELRQSEEMEKLHRSPADSSGIEPKSEAAECRASQIPAVQKIREPSLHSVVEEKPKRRTKDQVQIMIPEQGTGTLSVHEEDKKSPEEYEGMPQEGKDSTLKELKPKPTQQISEHLQEIVILPPVSDIFSVAVSPSDTEKHENTVIVDAAVMGLISQQSTIVTPGASPTQAVSHSPQLISSKDGVTEKLKIPVHASGQNDYVDSNIYSDISLTRTVHLIPDLKITRCSSAEEDVEGDHVTEKQDIVPLSDAPQILQEKFKDKQSFMTSDSSADAQTADEMEPISVVCEMPKPTVTARPAPLPVSVTTSADTEPVSMICVPHPVTVPSPAETQSLVKAGAPPLAVALPPLPTSSELNPLSAVCLVAQTISSSTSPSLPFHDSNISLHPTSVLALDPTPASASAEMEPISVISEVPKVTDNPAPHSTCTSAPGPASFLPPVLPPAEIEPLTVVCEVPYAKDTSAPQVKDTSASSPLALDLSAASTEISASKPHPYLEKAPPTLPPVMAQVTIFVPTTVPSPELKSSLELVTVSNASVPAAPVTASSSQPAPPPCPSPLNLSTYMHSVVVDIQRGVKDSMKATDVERSVAPPQTETISSTFSTKSYAMPPQKSSTKEHVVISVPSLDTDSLITHSSKYVKPVDSPVSSAVVGVSSLPAITLYSSSPPRIGSTPGALITSSVRTAPPSPVALLSYSSQERVDGPLRTQSLPPPYQPQPPFSLRDMPPVCTAPPPPIISPTGPLALSKPMTMAPETEPVRDLSTSYSMYRPQVPPPILSPIPDRLPVNIHQEEALSPHYKYTVSQPPITSSTLPTSPHSISALSLNLSTSPECQMNAASPKSPRTPRSGSSLNGAYVVITLPSQPNSPTESITTQVSTNKCEVFQTKMAHPTFDAPNAFTPFTQYTKSVEHQGMHGGHMAVSVSGQPASFPNLVTQVVTTEVQRTMVSLICERLPPSPTPRSPSIAISIPSEMATKVQLKPKENGTVPYSGDVVDLRTLKISIPMTEKGMDLSSLDSRRQSFSSDSSGRPTSAVHSAIVNLSAAASPVPTLSFVTDSITVTCSATVTPSSVMDRPLTHASVFSTPLQLTTSKTFEPVAQIIYRPLDSKPLSSFCIDTPINLSLGAITGIETSKSPIGDVPVSMTNGTMCIETGVVGAVDLTKTKPLQTVVTLEESTSEVFTTVIEDDPQPVDLTGGRRAVCCDMVYKLPFAGICTTPQPAPALPEDRFGYRDDHYQYNRSGPAGSKGFCGMKPSMSDTNLSEAGVFFYKSKNSYDYHNGPVEGAVDLSSGKMSTGEIMDYSSRSAERYARMTLPPYAAQRPAAGTHFSVNSVLKCSNGVVYSSVAVPIPSTYAITTQPVSIFSTAYKDFSGMHSRGDQCLSPSYSFLTTPTMGDGCVLIETGKETLPSAFPAVIPMVTGVPGAYIDAPLETVAAPTQPFSAPVLQGSDGSQEQQFQKERELLELEKMKQLRQAEELEWERQEMQMFREHEQIIVQQELEKLQTMKQQLLFQQEEERQAHLMMQQETYAQHQLQLEQIHQLQQQLQLHLQEQKMREVYGYDPSEGVPPLSGSEQIPQDIQYVGHDDTQFWPVKDETTATSVVTGLETPQNQAWFSLPTQGVGKYIPIMPGSDVALKESDGQVHLQLSNTIQLDGQKTTVDSGVQADSEDVADRAYAGRRRRTRKSVDSSVQTDEEDQDEWDVPSRSRRRARSSRSAEGERGKQSSKLSSIAIQTVAEISVQTEPSGPVKRPSVRAHVDTKVELCSPEKSHRGGSLTSERRSPQRDKRRPGPLEIGYSAHLKADGSSLQVAPSTPKSPKVLFSPVSPLSPKTSLEYVSYEKSIGDSSPHDTFSSESSNAPNSTQPMDLNMSKLTADRQTGSSFHFSDSYSGKGTQKKVRRTLPNPPQEEEPMLSPCGYSTGSARRRLCRNITMARAKILQDIDRELSLVERESSKLRKKQAELDEEEKEIDAKLRYLEMGINRRKDALLKEREKRERDYLQGVAEERDYMSDSEVSNIREPTADSHILERPKTAPQSDLEQFIPPQGAKKSPYSVYQYASPTQTPPQTFYECAQASPYQTQSIYTDPTLSYPQASHQHSGSQVYQKSRHSTLSELETKITTNYEIIRNPNVLLGPSTDSTYDLTHLGGKYSSLRMGVDERGSIASSPMSSISADSLYTDVDHHAPKSYVLLNDISELTKGSSGLSSSFSIPDKDLAKADRLLRAAELRDFLGPLQASSRLHPCMKVQEDAMEEPYELKLLKQQIKQEFRRGASGLDPLTGLPHCYPSDSGYRHFPRADKYSIGRLTLEKQAAKQLPASVLYQKQAKHKKATLDPKLTKFSSIHESRDLGLDYSSYLTPSGTSVSGLTSRSRLLQDNFTFGLRKNITEQQKYLGSNLGVSIAQSLNLGQSLNLSPHSRSPIPDSAVYPSGSRSRPSSRPCSVYGIDLSIKRDLSSSSLRLKMESDGTSILRAKPSILPISQSRGRIPIIAQNSEEESPLSPVGQPMGMARASAGPLPPISADLRDQFGSSHSLPEVQQHMKEESRSRVESRARVYDRDLALLTEDMQSVVSDSEAYHLRQEEMDWFNGPWEGRVMDGNTGLHKQIHQLGEVKPRYPYPYARVNVQRDPNDHSVSGAGLGIRVVGGKEIPGNSREIGAYVAEVFPGSSIEHAGKIVEGMQVLEWDGIPLTGKTFEEVQGLVMRSSSEVEICVRLDLNMLSDSGHLQCLEILDQPKAGDRQRSPGIDPKQLAAELQKVSQQKSPSSVLPAMEKGQRAHPGATPSPARPGSPSVSKKRHSSKLAEPTKTQMHPITGDIQLQINYDRSLGNLIIHVLQARNLSPRDGGSYSDPFVKVYLLPGRGQVMVVQNASAENKRRSKSMNKSLNPEWNQTVIYKNIHLEQLKKKTLEVTVWDYDRMGSNDFLGEVLIDLSNTVQLDNTPRWLALKEQGDVIDHGRAPPGQSALGSKSSVIKSRSHGVFPDPSKDMQLPTIEKSHSSPGSSKSSSEGHLRSHGPSRSQSKSSVGQTLPEEPVPGTDPAIQHLRTQPVRPSQRTSGSTVKNTSVVSTFAATDLNLEEEDGADAIDSAIFHVPQIGKTIPNGTDGMRGLDHLGSAENIAGKTQAMGEIKVALKKETKTEGEQLVVEILQCRNITYKFKSPDHLPDLYVKLYVVNVATQKKVIKKKTRVCRHDREPSFNETFRFILNPAGHSIQLFLVSNGGKFVKKTLVGEAYIWLDKVDLKKRSASWHKLLASSPQSHP
ncbi:protein piccolo-like isoform X4 [Paramormyrops kingsleyae]|uniref:protein piccolo-like isoform X4 n=1 Tax=Paramormyrops kingsleyae TaxID=1676925 RepID=UPI003B97AF17